MLGKSIRTPPTQRKLAHMEIRPKSFNVVQLQGPAHHQDWSWLRPQRSWSTSETRSCQIAAPWVQQGQEEQGGKRGGRRESRILEVDPGLDSEAAGEEAPADSDVTKTAG